MKRYSPYLAAAVSGILLFVAVLHTVFLLSWLALVPLFFALDHASPRQALRIGSCTGLMLSVCAFAWMIPGASAFTGGPDIYGILIFLICTIIFSIGWAILSALLASVPNPLLVASIWTLAEAGLQWAAQTMPWFLFHMANGISANLYAIQPISYIGIGGAGFVLVFVNYSLAHALIHRSLRRTLLPMIILITYMLLGWQILHTFQQAHPADPTPSTTSHNADPTTASQPAPRPFTITLIAANTPPGTSWDETNGNQQVQQLLELEHQAVTAKPDMIGWSESAIPWTYRPDDDLILELLKNSDPAKITHLIGMNTEYTTTELYNTAYCLLPGGKIAGRYDKASPLLLIEQPWNGWSIPFLSSNGYTVRPGAPTPPLPTPYGKAGILICNESALPAAAADRVRHGAQYLYNMSNDGWFADTYLASLHFYNARLRAVETRKDIAINSNNGWTGLVLATGEIIQARRSDIPFITTITVQPNNIQPPAVTHPWLPIAASLLIILTSYFVTLVPAFQNHKPAK